jgi:hypothetical protein
MRTLLTILSLAPFTLTIAACGGPSLPREEHWSRLGAAINASVASPAQSAEHSRVVQAVVDDGALDDLSRAEVEAHIGRGDDCSRHPRCAELGFEPDDWYYAVGRLGDGASGNLPALIVGFDRTGRVAQVWNLRTH